MSKSPWAIANFWFLSEPGGMDPSCTSPGMFALRTMAGGGGVVDVLVAVVVVVAVVAVVDVVSVDAVVSVAGISFLHATASTSSVIVASLFMSPPSPISNEERAVERRLVGRIGAVRVEWGTDGLLEAEVVIGIDRLFDAAKLGVVVAVELARPVVQQRVDVIAVRADRVWRHPFAEPVAPVDVLHTLVGIGVRPDRFYLPQEAGVAVPESGVGLRDLGDL